MADVQAGDVALLRQRVQRATEMRIAAESRLADATAEEARLLAEIGERWNVGTLADLEALLLAVEAERVAKSADLAAALDEAAERVAALPQ